MGVLPHEFGDAPRHVRLFMAEALDEQAKRANEATET